MAKPSKQLTVEEIPSEYYPEIMRAQLEALPFMSLHLVETIRDLLASGALVQVDNKIIPNTKRPT